MNIQQQPNCNYYNAMGFKWLQKDLARALRIAGNSDRYQFTIIALLCGIFFLNIFLIIGPSIYFMDPLFTCDASGKNYDQAYACSRLDQCTISNDFTIVAKMGIYCSQQYKRSIIQSSLSLGSLLGLIVMNVVSDLRGRRYALLTDLMLASVSALLTYLGAVVQSTPLLVLASVMSGFSGYSLIIISYIILGDICEQTLRQKYTVYINMCLSLGLCMFYFIYNWFNQWYNILVLFMGLPLVAITIVCWMLVEQSPNYWLFVARDVQACTATLLKIAKFNKKGYADWQRIKLLIGKITRKMHRKRNQYGADAESNVLRSLAKWKYLKVIVFMAAVESGGNLLFYGIGYAINDIGYNFGVMNLVLGLTEIITTLVMGSFVTRLQRKKTLAILYGMTPVLAAFFKFPTVTGSPLLSTLLIVLMRVMTTSGYFMVVMIQTQSFPLEIQSIGAGSIQAFSQLGSFAAPFLNAFSINHGLSRVTTMGLAMMFCLLGLIFVPESSSTASQKSVATRAYTQRLIKSQKTIGWNFQ